MAAKMRALVGFMAGLMALVAVDATAQPVNALDFSGGTLRVFDGLAYVSITGVVSASNCATAGQFDTFAGREYYCNGSKWVDPTCGTPGSSCAGTAAGTRDFFSGAYNTCDGSNWYAWVTGSCVPSWNPSPSGLVYALAVSGNTVYLGGQFVTVSGTIRNQAAAVDATTGAATPWAPTISGGYVQTFVVSGNTVYLGGDFTTVSGTTRNRAAAVDATMGALK